MIIIVNHKTLLNQERERKVTEISRNSIHLDYLSSDMSIDKYVELCIIYFFYLYIFKGGGKFTSGNVEIVVRDEDRIVYIEIEDGEFHASDMNVGLYLYSYNKGDVY